MKRGKKKKNKDDEFIYFVCDDTEIECELTEEESYYPSIFKQQKKYMNFVKLVIYHKCNIL